MCNTEGHWYLPPGLQPARLWRETLFPTHRKAERVLPYTPGTRGQTHRLREWYGTCPEPLQRRDVPERGFHNGLNLSPDKSRKRGARLLVSGFFAPDAMLLWPAA